MRLFFRRYILAWDFVATIVVATICYFCLPNNVNSSLAKDFYGIGISVLSIVFSVYFAALAVLITSSADEFIRFLEEEGDYTEILSTFKVVLGALFIALIIAIIMYFTTTLAFEQGAKTQSCFYLVFFVALFFYGMFAVASSVSDAIRFAHNRARFLKLK